MFLRLLVIGLEDDSVNEFNFNSKGYKEGRKLVDKLRRDLFRKLSDEELDEFMNVLSNSFDLVRKQLKISEVYIYIYEKTKEELLYQKGKENTF